jgi:C-terminal processing protease CtpA/Prc
MVVRETDDGSAFVTFITPDAAADNAGIELGAEIVEFNGMPIADAISEVLPITSPFSTDHVRRLNQAALLTRLPVGTTVDVTYINPGGGSPQTVTLNADFEFESYDAALATEGAQPTGYELPVEYELLDSGFVLARIWSFQDNDLLTIQLWERLMQTLNDQGAAGLIIDMRNNGGGAGFLADQMAAYFFDEPLLLGGTANYDRSVGTFVLDEERPDRFYLPPENLRYRGQVAVLVGPNCVSACEFFADNMTQQDRAAIVGHYPTGGLGGSITDFAMPNDLFVRFTTGRALDAEGNVHIEGQGVAPTVRVPVTAESLLSDDDEVLQAAVDYLSGR